MDKPIDPHMDARVERCVDLTIRRAIYGLASGSLAAVLLFRRPSVRTACVGFGAGMGVGSAFTECQRDLEALLGYSPSSKN
mmetsp:Transcript_12901/g.17641  ORF Transcript_12901/g.17641 Transcript_12901/m.17641 type:complete len:81 (-) Transcript_12901:363-605(-)